VQYQSFLNNLVEGKVEKFSEQLNTYLTEAFSVPDTGYTAEKFYHGLVLGLIASLRSIMNREMVIPMCYFIP
jgi:small nuclear ribonucleoprotein (snRNP)-like protein